MKIRKNKQYIYGISKENIDLFNSALNNTPNIALDSTQGNQVGESQQEVSGVSESLTEGSDTKAWMVRRDGKEIPVLIHIYGNAEEDDLEECDETMWAAEWLYQNTMSKDVKKMILDFLASWAYQQEDFEESNLSIADYLIREKTNLGYNVLTEKFLKKVESQLEKANHKCNVMELIKKICDALNEEFMRVRAGGEINSDSNLGDLYFRISSHNFNWFDIIWNFVYGRRNTARTVTIQQDIEPFSKKNNRDKYYRHNGKVFNRMPLDDFITIDGKPFISESLDMVKEKTNDKFLNEYYTLWYYDRDLNEFEYWADDDDMEEVIYNYLREYGYENAVDILLDEYTQDELNDLKEVGYSLDVRSNTEEENKALFDEMKFSFSNEELIDFLMLDDELLEYCREEAEEEREEYKEVHR